MLSFQKVGSHGPLLFLLHWLGGNADTWRGVMHDLAPRGLTCVAVDLPGFGGSASISGTDVAAMADQVIEVIHHVRHTSAQPNASWAIAGHSMGGKVAAVVARRAKSGEAGLEDLGALALVSASPPGPEPMTDTKRADLLKDLGQSSGDAATDQKHAAAFVDDNTGNLALPTNSRERAIDGITDMRRTAFRAWLEDGSLEDWIERVGVLDLPAIVFAGTKDSALGPEAQRTHTLPHLASALFVELQGAGHLAPLERQGELVEHLTTFLSEAHFPLRVSPQQPGPAMDTLMHSAHTSPRTLAAMQRRLEQAQDWNHPPVVFSAHEFRTLRVLAARVVPDAGFDLAACLDMELASGDGDGWRFADLPEDRAAWKQGLASLDVASERKHDVPFLGLFPDQQQALLKNAAAGDLGPTLLARLHLSGSAVELSAESMQHWFEDVRAEFTRMYMGDPRTMDRIGYTGFADDLGFTQIQLGQQEEFER